MEKLIGPNSGSPAKISSAFRDALPSPGTDNEPEERRARRQTRLRTHKEPHMRARPALAILAASLMATTACGAFHEASAAQKVHDAFDHLNNSHEATIDFRLAASPSQLIALDAADPGSDHKMSNAQASEISGLGVTVALRSDKPLKDALDASNTSTGKLDPSLDMDLAVHNGAHANVLEYRSVAGKAYVKVNVMALAKLSGDTKSIDEARMMQAQANSLPRYLEPFKRLLKGGWVSIDPAQFANLSKQMGGDTKPSPKPSLNAAQRHKITDTLSKIFVKDTTIKDKGTSHGVDTIEITANARTLITDIQKQVFPVLKDVPGIGGKLPTEAPTSVPTTPAKMTIKLNADGGTLNAISIDLAQFDASKGQHLPIALTFKNKAVNTTAPAGAIPFDPSALKDMMGSSLGS
ncbi:hypothetical protein ACWDWS_38110 [Streptomyces sp. NPDC003328]